MTSRPALDFDVPIFLVMASMAFWGSCPRMMFLVSSVFSSFTSFWRFSHIRLEKFFPSAAQGLLMIFCMALSSSVAKSHATPMPF